MNTLRTWSVFPEETQFDLIKDFVRHLFLPMKQREEKEAEGKKVFHIYQFALHKAPSQAWLMETQI